MKAYKTVRGIIVEIDNEFFLIDEDWDSFFNNDQIFESTTKLVKDLPQLPGGPDIINKELLPPIGNQEVWASGVTYYKSRIARMEESSDSGGTDFYDRVYHAERPELFFKSLGYRTVGHQQKVRIRKDSSWNVPEPELTLALSSSGKIIGYTIGNDMSSRDIEGQNPLYLPQAKTYNGSTAIGPCILITEEPLKLETEILIEIIRNKRLEFSGEIRISQIKRSFTHLVKYLFRELSFEHGCFLMTGTGIIPPDSFSLISGDIIKITIEPIGVLNNTVAED